MSFYFINGQCRIVHSEPDGDSVHFIPGNPGFGSVIAVPGQTVSLDKEITDLIEASAGRQAAASARSASRLTSAA